jgi:hypothetical protein
MNAQGVSQTSVVQLDGQVIACSTVKHLPKVFAIATGARSW